MAALYPELCESFKMTTATKCWKVKIQKMWYVRVCARVSTEKDGLSIKYEIILIFF